MGKISYASLKLKTDVSVKEFDFNGNKYEVLNYLPISDKHSLINITLQKSREDNFYNALKIDMYFHLHLIYMYSNLVFTDKQKEDEEKIYDCLKSNGLLDKILEEIPENEYEDLLHFMEEEINNEMKYNTTTAALIGKFITDLPTQAQAAMDIVNNFDKTKFEEVIKFAEAANGDRPITARS